MSPSAGEAPAGLDALFQYQVQQRPDAIAVVQGDSSLTYRTLNDYVNQLASTLATWNLRLEEPVCILVPNGIGHIAAQIAIIRLGGSCVPMDIFVPDQRIHELLGPLDVRIVVTTASEKHRVVSFQYMIIADGPPDIDTLESLGAAIPASLPTGGNHRTHVLHTSGTTSLPKPVEILAKGITRMAFNKLCVQFGPDDRVAQVCAPSFDVSLFEIWATLVRAAAVICISKNVLLNPFAFVEQIQKHGVSVIAFTTAMVSQVVTSIPNAFENVETVLVGGEKANIDAMKVMLQHGPPRHLVHSYGPTECTAITTFHLLTLDELNRGLAPIGRPLDGTTCFILDDRLQFVKHGKTGELYVAGDGLARDYFQRADANAKSFLHLPSLRGDGTQKLTRVYKTGDLCRYTEQGCIEFVARADDQIKLRGFRIVPGEIESILLNSQLLEAVIVVPVQRSGKDTYLTAFITPKEASFSSSGFEEYMKTTLEYYKIPRVKVVDAFLFTVHGKIDRQALKTMHINILEEDEKRLSACSSSQSIAWLKDLWISSLDVHEIDEDSDFFGLGGSSIQAAAMIVRVQRKYGKLLSIKDIYNNSTLKSLSDCIENGTEPGSVDQSVVNGLLEDTLLTTDVMVHDGPVPDWRAPEEGHIFLTGATGFLGTYFLRYLIDQEYVKSVGCLVRAPNALAGHERLIAALTKYGLATAKNLHKIEPIPGALEIDQFGLSDTAWRSMADSISVIFHLGAHVNHVQTYEKHEPSNVLGTLTTLRLATTGHKKAVHFTSTAAVSGPMAYFSDVKTIFEDQPLSTFKTSLAYDLGYIRSKWVAENLIQDMIAKGLPAVIYRPGFLMGDTISGHGNSEDFMARFIMGCIKLGCCPILHNQSKALVPIDFFNGALIHIASNPRNYGQTFHLVPQTPEDDFDLELLWEMISDCEQALKAVTYKDWLDALSQDGHLSSNPLLPLLLALQEPVHRGNTRWELWNNMAGYEVLRTKKALQDGPVIRSGIVFSDVERQVRNWKVQGLL